MNHLSEHQQVLLKTYKEFLLFCDQNNLPFFAAYGTMIGAIRHHGFIPWDDDIDVFMFRKDYDRFVELRNSMKGDLYKIADCKDGESPYPFAKFYTTEGTIWEYSQFPFIIGPWIDVFPLDEGSMEDEKSNKVFEKFHKTMWEYRKAIAYASWRDISSDFLHLNMMEGTMKLIKKLRYAPFKKKYIREIEHIWDEIRAIKSDTLRGYSIALSTEVFSKSWFKESIEVPFEDTVMPVTIGYHECLTYLFGNYMQLPPEDKRVGHLVYFMDLKNTLTRNEILKNHKDKLTEKSSMTFRVIIDELMHRAKGWPRPGIKKKDN